MALIRCEFFSEALELSTTMTVILPQATATQIGMRGAVRAGAHPTLYLLHGLSDDDTIWTRRTSIERYVAPLGLAVVMPQVHRSFYTDMACGNRYWTFLSEELPTLARSFFPLSTAREDTFVAGLSMGGYGAFKWALRHPHRFAAAASLSGAVDVARLHRARGSASDVLHQAFGAGPVAGTDDDLLAVLDRAGESVAELPRLYLCCGEQDELYRDNITFRDVCRRVGAPLTWDFGPGEHDWAYWDRTIQDVLAWLPLA